MRTRNGASRKAGEQAILWRAYIPIAGAQFWIAFSLQGVIIVLPGKFVNGAQAFKVDWGRTGAHRWDQP
jgi:hypothetical protein